MSVVFAGVEVAGKIVNVRVDGAFVTALGESVPMEGADVVEGNGGALIPGLHDHHIHTLALAASLDSVDCSRSLDELRTAPGDGWIRGVGYHESIAGDLDRGVLDAVVSHRPVRVQHRSGALWVLNTLGLERVTNCLDESADVERDRSGRPTGRLWRYDQRLRACLSPTRPNLAATIRKLHEYGITGVTDATPDLDAEAMRALGVVSGSLSRILLLGSPDGHPGAGPRKFLLRDHDLPPYDELLDAVCATHNKRRAVAIHCVTAEALALTLAVLRDAGAFPGDRVEHAAVVPDAAIGEMARLGVAVITQPSFLRLRGESYLSEVPPGDHDLLYPYASLLRHGVRVAPSSDAPYGDLDPWRTMRDAMTRTTSRGNVVGARERVPASVALAGYLSEPHDPGGRARQVLPGAPADLVLLHAPLADVLQEPSNEHVRAVLVHGEQVGARQ